MSLTPPSDNDSVISMQAAEASASVPLGRGDDRRRVESLPFLHDIRPEQDQLFAAAIDLKNAPRGKDGRITIVEPFCGTGYASKIAVRQALSLGIPLNLYLYDIDQEMLDTAKQEITEMVRFFPNRTVGNGDNKGFINIHTVKKDLSRIEDQEIPQGVQVCLAKMGFHEVPEEAQQSLIGKIRSSLVPGGKLVSWEVFAPEEFDFAAVIRAKDAIAGRQRLVENRSFFTKNRFLEMLKNSSFGENVVLHGEWQRAWSTIQRYIYEFGAQDISMLADLNQAVANEVPQALRTSSQHELLNGLVFNVPSGIVVATAP